MSIRVALVEDNDDLRTSMKSLLKRSARLRVVADYSDAESAPADLVRHKPDVVLMDVKLPRMDGVECARLLKSLLPTVLIIMLTIHDDNDCLLYTSIFDEFETVVSWSAREKILHASGK